MQPTNDSANDAPDTRNSDVATLSPLLYAELKALAARALREERAGHTLQTTALVHEAWLRVADQRQLDPRNRGQFLGLSAQMMRRVLVDHARRRTAAKRPTSETQVLLSQIESADPALVGLDANTGLISLDSALERLREISPRQIEIIDLPVNRQL
ncbi:MAG: hypothetical protein KDI51_12800 [Xanthomonadales bacterium]|nr:hypothetical protein [Xanthomonadales bacterium]MCB1635465.1 hypothetical protein [Xanthomonadales bacterium]